MKNQNKLLSITEYFTVNVDFSGIYRKLKYFTSENFEACRFPGSGSGSLSHYYSVFFGGSLWRVEPGTLAPFRLLLRHHNFEPDTLWTITISKYKWPLSHQNIYKTNKMYNSGSTFTNPQDIDLTWSVLNLYERWASYLLTYYFKNYSITTKRNF